MQKDPRNLLSDEEEIALGNLVSEQFEQQFRILHDSALNNYLQKIGDGLLTQMPPSKIPVRFQLVDAPVVNAVTVPGGRIYVSRKLVAFTKNEDELAGVLSHELGHALTHQGAADFSSLMQQVLRISEIRDVNDLNQRYHELLENIRRHPPEKTEHKEQEQYIADALGMYMLAKGGYEPKTLFEFWDRMADTRGKTGNWISDFFGATKPAERRLREMQRAVAALPPACVSAKSSRSEDEYARWQSGVVSYSSRSAVETNDIPGLISKKALEPPLQGDFRQVRFSPDGNYLLAQDDAGIYVLSRSPFQPKYRIEAANAENAQFTSDSQSIVFTNPDLRVEKWNISGQNRTAVHEVVVLPSCFESLLSPDGNTLACLNREFTLLLIDVNTGSHIFEKKEFYIPSQFLWMFLPLLQRTRESIELVQFAFSSDSHYFVAGNPTSPIAYDLSAHSTVSLPSKMKAFLEFRFAFLAHDRLMGVNPADPQNSGVVEFPSGEMIDKLRLGKQTISAAGHGNFAVLRPIDKFAVGVVDLSKNQIILASKEQALDVYDGVYARAKLDGTISLFDVVSHATLGMTALPRATLGGIRTSDASADLKWLAISERSRGAIWNLQNGERLYHVRGFRGTYLDGEKAYTDFPELDETQRMIAVLSLDRVHDEAGMEIGKIQAQQFERFLLMIKPSGKPSWPLRDADIELHDVTTGALVWNKHYAQEVPEFFASPAENCLMVIWPASGKGAKAEINSDPATRSRFGKLSDKDGNFLVQVFELSSSRKIGEFPVSTGKSSFSITGSFAAGDWICFTDNENRVLIYDLNGVQNPARIFGHRVAVSTAAKLLCVQNQAGKLDFYDLSSLQKTKEVMFPSRVSFAQFSSDGKKLLAVTDDQYAYTIDLNTSTLPSSQVAAKD